MIHKIIPLIILYNLKLGLSLNSIYIIRLGALATASQSIINTVAAVLNCVRVFIEGEDRAGDVQARTQQSHDSSSRGVFSGLPPQKHHPETALIHIDRRNPLAARSLPSIEVRKCASKLSNSTGWRDWLMFDQ